MPDAPRRLIVLGGSNSVLRDGWTSHLRERGVAGFEVVNLSLGAATTLMGLYRLLAADPLRAGDTVVWEYALNEYNHWRSGVALPVLEHQLRWLLRLCARAGAGMVPVLMQNRPQFLAPEEDAYLQAVRGQFAAAGLDPVCCAALLRDRGPLPDAATLYSDTAHYDTGHALLCDLAGCVAERAERGAPVPVVQDAADETLTLVREFEGRAPVRFVNSLIACDEYPLTGHLRAEARGQVLGAIVMAAEQAHGLWFEFGNGVRCGPFGTRVVVPEGKPERVVKQLNVQAACGARATAAGRVGIRPLPRLIVQQTYAAPPGQSRPRQDAIVALVVEGRAAVAAPPPRRNWLRRLVDRRPTSA
jgi:hypothetical protein